MQVSAACSLILESAVKSTVVLGVAWLAVALLRAKSAATRHVIWSAAFAGLLALPLLSLALPALRVPVRGSLGISDLVFKEQALGSNYQEDARVEESYPVISTPRLLTDWRLLLLLMWAGGASFSLAKMLIGWASVERLRSKARPLSDPDLTASVAFLQLGNVELLEGAPGTMPMTYGMFRHAIFIPADARQWTAHRRRMVLLHELAHVRRRDAATHLSARMALVLYWWNPLVWLAWREFLRARELAADDLVLKSGACGWEYAGQLLDIARSMQAPALAWPVVAMASRSQLEGRLEAILDAQRDRRAPRRVFAATVLVAAMAMIAPLAALQAKTGGSQEPTNGSSSSGLLQAGDTARDKGKNDEAKAAYTRVINISGNGPGAATAFIRRGTVELAMKDFPAAISDFEQAQTADSAKTSEAKMWMAVAQQREGDPSAAAASYQASLAAADPHSHTTAVILRLYSQLLDAQEKHDDATELRRQASEIQSVQAEREPISRIQTEVYRAGKDVHAPALLSKVEPGYTAEARIAGYSGTVVLSVVIGEDGVAQDIRVTRTLGLGLDEKAVQAVTQWRFKPGTKDGQPVAVRATIEVNFGLV